jgi:hypothetical protein
MSIVDIGPSQPSSPEQEGLLWMIGRRFGSNPVTDSHTRLSLFRENGVFGNFTELADNATFEAVRFRLSE